MKEITYKNKTLKSSLWTPELSDEDCDNFRKYYYRKPPKHDVIKNIRDIHCDGVSITAVRHYFFKDLMAKCRLNHSKWSVEEALECNDIIRHFYGKTKSNDNFFDNNLNKNLATAIRFGKGIACGVTNFPIKMVDNILEKYNVNNNYYDFSCGWGVRLLSASRNRINYYGVDPNTVLVKRLQILANLYKKVNNIKSIKTDIRVAGSQELIPEWVGKIGLAFSSPPYFDLEDYKIGDQSFKPGIEYSEWINTYAKPTISNTFKYLVNGGYLLLNIKNIKKYPLYDDFRSIASGVDGYVDHGNMKLENIARINKDGAIDTSEKIMIFRKIIDDQPIVERRRNTVNLNDLF